MRKKGGVTDAQILEEYLRRQLVQEGWPHITVEVQKPALGFLGGYTFIAVGREIPVRQEGGLTIKEGKSQIISLEGIQPSLYVAKLRQTDTWVIHEIVTDLTKAQSK